MAFNAGTIEASLTLDRTPFQAGLDAAKAEAARFAGDKYEAKLGIAGEAETKAKIDSVRASAERLATTASSIKVDADTLAAQEKFDRIHESAARLGTDSPSIRVDADTDTAEARLAALNAAVNRVDGQTINIDVDTSQIDQATGAVAASGDAAEGAASQFNAMFAGIMAAYPPVSTALIAIPGLMSLAIAPAAAVAVGMSGISAAAAPLQGQFMDLQSIVSATFDRGLKPAIADTVNLMPTLTAGLVGTASALTGIAQQVTQVAASQAGLAALQATFSNVQSTIAAMGPGVAGLVQNFLDLSALGSGSLTGLAGVVNSLSTQWHELITNLSQSGVAQTAISSLVSILGSVAALIPPLVQQGVQLMAVLGPPLAGAIQLLGGALNFLAGPLGGLTTTVLAAVAAWKLLQAVTGSAIFEGIIGQVSSASAAFATYRTNLVANNAAQTAASAAAAAYSEALTVEAGAIARAEFAYDRYVAAVAAGSGVEAAAAAATTTRNQALVASAAASEAKARADAAAAVAAETAAGGDTIYAQAAGRVSAANAAAAASSTEAATAAAGNAAATQAAAAAQAEAGASAAAAAGGITAEAAALAAAATAAEAEAVSVAAAATVATEGAAAAVAHAAALTADAEAAAVVASTAAQAATVIATLTGAQSSAAATAAATAAALEAEAAAATSAAAAAEADAAALTALAGSATRAAAATTVTAASMRAQATAAAGAGAGAVAAGSALATFTTALTVVGVAAIAGYVAVKSFTTSTDEAAKALEQGGQAAADMRAKVASQTETTTAAAGSLGAWTAEVDNWISSQIFGIATTQSATDALNEQRAAMTPLQLAQSLATEAQGNYTKAVKDFGPASSQAQAAQAAYAQAMLAVTQAQAGATVAAANVGVSMQAASAHFGDAAQAADGAAQATVTYAAALASLADPMASAGDKVKAFAADMQNASDAPRTLLQAMNDADKAITNFADSTIKITPAMVDASGAINTTTKDGQALATGILGSAKAFDNLRGATIASSQAAGDNLTTALAKASVATEDFRQKLIAQAMQHGATREQAQNLVNTYLAFPPSIKTEVQQPGMVQAVADSLGLTGAITAIPNDKSIIVNSLTDDAKTRLEDLGLTVTTLPNGQIMISADATAATTEIQRAKDAASIGEALIPIGATTAGYDLALRDGVGAALATTGANIPVGGNTAPFNSDVAGAAGAAAGTTATIPIDGNAGLFNGKVIAGVAQANGSTGTITIDGNPTTANGKTTAAVTFANGSKGTITIDGNQVPVNGKIDASVTYGNGKTSIIKVDANAAAANAAIDNAARARNATITVTTIYVGSSPAAVRQAGAGGGIVGFSGGGIVPPVHMGTGGILPGYAPGIDTIPAILSPGEAVLVPELVKELGPANILAANLAASGGRKPTFWNNGQVRGGDGAAAPPISGLRYSGGRAAGGAGEVVAELRALRDQLAALRPGGTTQIDVQVDAAVGEAADEINRSLRHLSDMGAFQR